MKRIYNALPPILRPVWVALTMAPFELRSLLRYVGQGRPQRYFTNELRGNDRSRGMSRWHDFIDWVGGYPYEVARPEVMVETFGALGFSFARSSTVQGWGCNELLFTKVAARATAGAGGQGSMSNPNAQA